MGDNEQKAVALVAEAEKKLTSSKGFFGGLFGGQNKQDEAVDCYARAANLFKMAKKWNQAGQTFVTLAQLHLKNGSHHDAATNYVDAANCYKKSDPKEAANTLLKAVDIYTDKGRFTIAAKHHQTIAEIYEGDGADFEKAVLHYEKAADFFRGEESNSSANKCLLKVAQYSAQMENYERAIQIYEQVAATAIESPLLKYSAKEYYFCASLCHMCVDSQNAQNAMKRYEEQFPGFSDSREAKLIKALIKHIEDEDSEAYTNDLTKFNATLRLDTFHTKLLLKIKKQIPDENELC